eukprot:CAMPEP_0119341254 /NCGR_PEP_ID=MMETSP1333-20130426/101963_1 /TAXON_ID=418940 /ORGANISM="Scyphosphaera apsteinii, Strain RCC1455" /LENGTH=184 /DNA_ID=CAMNT_0007353177 /DNA_START=24 /DNA_END=574 /DNA_ORIENTATION=+
MKASSIVVMRDNGIANAGLIYVRPGSRKALNLLLDLAWRIQLFLHFPSVVPLVVPFAKPPFYSNSDDQSLLNDAITSAVLHNRTFLGSTARFEARNKYKNVGPEWSSLAESRQHHMQLKLLWKSATRARAVVPWQEGINNPTQYMTLPISKDDSVALAPRCLFAHLPFSTANAITHLTSARGFA